MASAKGRVLNLLGRFALTDAEVVRVEPRGASFVSIELQGPSSVAYAPGTKIQVVLPSQDVRTYTPIERGGGRVELLAFRHGTDTPAMRWLDGLAVGRSVRFKGPDRSLELPADTRTFVGDETAIAVAASYRHVRGPSLRVVFETTPGIDATEALEAVGLRDAVVVPRSDPTASALIDAVDTQARVGMAGGGAFLKRVRNALRSRGASAFKVKAYWVAGRVGLD